MSRIYEKWRELSVDPFTIQFDNIKLQKIISYLPAGNDVVECEGFINGEHLNVIIKIERSKVADFVTEASHLKKLKEHFYLEPIPCVYEEGKINDKTYLVLEKLDGDRLSDIFDQNITLEEKHQYLIDYGKALAMIHEIPCDVFDLAKQRIINDFPKKENYATIDEFINNYITYLKNNKPEINFDTFIHGDFHYANILWENTNISGILDFEYSGRGFKEQDIAWACVLRPTQHFMDNIEDIKCFLNGYLTIGNFDYEKFKWCLINAYCHFYLMNINNDDYKNKLIKLLPMIKEKNIVTLI